MDREIELIRERILAMQAEGPREPQKLSQIQVKEAEIERQLAEARHFLALAHGALMAHDRTDPLLKDIMGFLVRDL